MHAHITAITLGVRDRAAARRFYVDGLGWRPVLEVEDGEVSAALDAAVAAGARLLAAGQ